MPEVVGGILYDHPVPMMAMDEAPNRVARPQSQPPRVPVAYDRFANNDEGVNMPDVTKALTALVALLQQKIPCTELDEISTMLDGGTDPATGKPTQAMDRMLARREIRQDATARAAAREALAERFPNHNRLGR